MGRFQIEYLPSAEKDLLEIVDYIKKDKPSAAVNLINTIDREISKLAEFPFLSPQPDEERLKMMGYRMHVIGNFIVFYVVKEKVVQIRRVLHGCRKYEFLL